MTKPRHTLGSTTRILIAFLLNLGFSLFELIGGTITGSAAIISDALHAFGDALSTGVAFVLERKSAKSHNARYSILGAIITTSILLAGAFIILESSVERFAHPEPVNYDGMLTLAIVGVIFSAAAAFITRSRHDQLCPHHNHLEQPHHFNQKIVSLHMLQDTLSWLIVLAGSLTMRFTDFALLDPILSVAVAVFIIISSIKNLSQILKLVEKAF